MSRRYAFTTVWHLDAPLEPVWHAIVRVEDWPRWWPSVRSVQVLEPGGEDGFGALHRFVWRGRLPYTLAFEMRTTERLRHRRLAGVATGELRGSGVWTFDADPGATRVRYDWNVETAKAWMNALAPMLEPAFHWNHDQVMRLGGEGLARHLGCRLLAIEEE